MKKRLFSLLLLCAISLLSVGVLAGCNDSASVADVCASYENLAKVLEANKEDIIKTPQKNTRNYYQINYGSVVNGLVDRGDEAYVDLKDYYNSIFSFAMSYIDENIEVITNYKDNPNEMGKETRATLASLKKSIDEFAESVPTFVTARNRLETVFETSMSEDAESANLRAFKREYANFVDKSVQFSLNLSNAVETDESFGSVNSVKLNKNYILNKILRAYNELYINNIAHFNFEGSRDSDGVTKGRIEDVLKNLQTSMDEYASIMELESLKVLGEDELEELKSMMAKFATEIDVYVDAVEILNLKELCIDNENDMAKYLQTNSRAEVALERIESFVNTSLGDFLTYLEDAVRR